MIIPTGIGTRLLRKPWLTYALVLLNVGSFFVTYRSVKEVSQKTEELFKAGVRNDRAWFESYLGQDCQQRSALTASNCALLAHNVVQNFVSQEHVDPAALAQINSFSASLYLQLKVPRSLQVGLYEYSKLLGREGTHMKSELSRLHREEAMFSVVNQNWWAALKSLFLHADVMHLLGNMLMLLIFGSLLEQKVSRSFMLAIYVTGGFLGLLPMVTLSKDSLSFFVGNSGCVAALMGAAWVAYKKFKIRCVFMPVFPLPFLSRAFMVPVVWALPCLYFAADILGFLSKQTGVAFDAHLIGIGVGALAIFYDVQSSEFRWPWISADEVRLFEASRRLPIDQRMATLRTLSLSNFSNYKTWTEWTRVALKYRQEYALEELSQHLHAQIFDHSVRSSAGKNWINVLSQMKNEASFELLFSRLLPIEVLAIVEKALDQEDSALAFKLLMLHCLRKDLHWMINSWVRRLKRNKMSPRFQELVARELDVLAQQGELPGALKKFYELLNHRRMPSHEALAA